MSLAIYNKTHRWVGFAIAIIVVLMSVTGIALNHSSAIGLGNQAMPAWAAEWFYGVKRQENPEYAVAGLTFSVNSAGRLAVEGNDVIACPALLGVLPVDPMLVAVCNDKLVLLTTDAELIEEFYFSQSDAGAVEQVLVLENVSGHMLLVNEQQRIWLLDLNTLQIQPAEAAVETLSGAYDVATPINIITPVDTPELTWERLVLDIHAGRIIGGWGVWLVDIVAIGLIWLALSGYLSWRARQKLINAMQ